MIVAVEGSKTFDDYDTFMRAMQIALSQPNDDSVIEVWSAGPHRINGFTAAFCNSTEDYLRQKGYRIVFKKMPLAYIRDNIKDVSYLAYLTKRNESASSLIAAAELNDTESGIFRV